MLLSEELKAAGIAVVLLQTEAGLNMEGPAASLDVDSDGALIKAPFAPPRLLGSSHGAYPGAPLSAHLKRSKGGHCVNTDTVYRASTGYAGSGS